jgi:hypothetical protein
VFSAYSEQPELFPELYDYLELDLQHVVVSQGVVALDSQQFADLQQVFDAA